MPELMETWASREAAYWWDDFCLAWALIASTNATKHNLTVAFASDDPEVHRAVAHEVAGLIWAHAAKTAAQQLDPKTAAMLGRRSLL